MGSYCVHVDFSSGEVGAWGSCPVLHVSCVQAVRVQVGRVAFEQPGPMC